MVDVCARPAEETLALGWLQGQEDYHDNQKADSLPSTSRCWRLLHGCLHIAAQHSPTSSKASPRSELDPRLW